MMNKIDEKTGEQVRKLYTEGYGSAMISLKLKIKTHTVERFVRNAGIMRTRAEAARAIAMRNGR